MNRSLAALALFAKGTAGPNQTGRANELTEIEWLW
ncbi:hypothetical protein SAMN05444169_4944 [Bradyrhizobium erythrophlei]|uniref:Uncharacterized protein n=1 Tax=Bradyrhizobium erythrophlei TaxID=1437360 RepID=A0A1M5P0C4_9BRAD|nr:hypothetical protein SAMN05444169_4944 [Bradyrhizobium erythrophlei]